MNGLVKIEVTDTTSRNVAKVSAPATLKQFVAKEARDVLTRAERINPEYLAWVAKRAHRD